MALPAWMARIFFDKEVRSVGEPDAKHPFSQSNRISLLVHYISLRKMVCRYFPLCYDSNNHSIYERGEPYAKEQIHNHHIQQAECYNQEKFNSLRHFKEKISGSSCV